MLQAHGHDRGWRASRPQRLAVSGDATERMVSFTFNDNSSNETRFELPAPRAPPSTPPTPSCRHVRHQQRRITDAQAIGGASPYAIRAANTDGVSAPSTAVNNVTVPRSRRTPTARRRTTSRQGRGTRAGSATTPAPGPTTPPHPPHARRRRARDDGRLRLRRLDRTPTALHTHHSTHPHRRGAHPRDSTATGRSASQSRSSSSATPTTTRYFVNGQSSPGPPAARPGDYRNAGRSPSMRPALRLRHLPAEQEGGSGVHFKWGEPPSENAVEVIPPRTCSRPPRCAAAPAAVTGAGLGNIVW